MLLKPVSVTGVVQKSTEPCVGAVVEWKGTGADVSELCDYGRVKKGEHWAIFAPGACMAVE